MLCRLISYAYTVPLCPFLQLDCQRKINTNVTNYLTSHILRCIVFSSILVRRWNGMKWVNKIVDAQLTTLQLASCIQLRCCPWPRFDDGLSFYKFQEGLVVHWIVTMTSIIDGASSSPTIDRDIVFWLCSDGNTQISDGFERTTSHQRPGGPVDSGMDFRSYRYWFKSNCGEQLLFWVRSEALVSGLTMSEPE